MPPFQFDARRPDLHSSHLTQSDKHMLDSLEAAARRTAPAVQQWAVRGVVEHSEELTVRQGVAQAPHRTRDAGAMVTVIDRGGLGYAATSDTSDSGLAAAFAQARELAHAV